MEFVVGICFLLGIIGELIAVWIFWTAVNRFSAPLQSNEQDLD